MRRLLLLIKGLGRGGAEQLILSSVPYLGGGRFEYEVAYLLRERDALVGDLRRAGIRVHCLDGPGPGWIARLATLVGDRSIDLLHAHAPVPAIGARVCFPRRRLPIVYTEHNQWERYHRATYWANALTFWRNDHVFAVSERVRASIRYPAALAGLPMPPVETRYYGIDAAAVGAAAKLDGVREELGIPEHAPVVGTVANFKHGKGHRDLIEAAVRVRSSIPDVRFVLVGRGPLEDDIRRTAIERGLASTFVFAGFRDDAHRLMSAFDVYAVPSVYDGLSIALVEAMSLGKPPVLTRSGGNSEVVQDGKHGRVVPSADPRALADAIIAVLRDERLRARLGDQARKRAADFDIRPAIERTETIYDALLDERR
jgi:glycosyltransferase involved in cell wall biosynthesis